MPVPAEKQQQWRKYFHDRLEEFISKGWANDFVVISDQGASETSFEDRPTAYAYGTLTYGQDNFMIFQVIRP